MFLLTVRVSFMGRANVLNFSYDLSHTGPIFSRLSSFLGYFLVLALVVIILGYFSFGSYIFGVNF